ncbi:MAG: hypothetical protein QRY71_04245 [Candidatus Rhabdochlamydia sp.]
MSEHDTLSWSPDKNLGQLVEERVLQLEEQAKDLLINKNKEGLALFQEAELLDPQSLYLLLRQGKTLLTLGAFQQDVILLKESAQKFEKALILDPTLFEVWHTSAQVFQTMHRISNAFTYLVKAQEKITTALTLFKTDRAASSGKLLWDAGLIEYQIFKHSGEVSDLAKAIHHLEEAALEEMPAEFWSDLGKAYASLSQQVSDMKPLLKSIQSYKTSLAKSLPNIQAWIGLGLGLKTLFSLTHDLDHFQQAYDCLTAASQMNPTDFDLWKERITLLIQAARLKKDAQKLKVALEQCKAAATILVLPPVTVLRLTHASTPLEEYRDDQEMPELFSPKTLSELSFLFTLWGEAFALLGEWEESIEYIKEAERKLDQAESFMSEDDGLFLIQEGKTLFSFAAYYEDIEFYYQALSRFQESVSLDRTLEEGWLWMGKTYAALFHLTHDGHDLAKAVRFYQKSLHLHPNPSLHFEIASLFVIQGESSHELELLEQAAEYFEHLFQTHPSLGYQHPEWFFSYGTALSLIGQLKEEVSFLKRALEAFICTLMFNPNHPGVHHRLGILYSHLGNETDNVNDFYRALQHLRLAEQSSTECDMVYIDWGMTLMSLSEYATDQTMEEYTLHEAEKKLMMAGKLGNQQSYYHLACLYSLKKMLDLSLHYLHKAFEAKALPSFEELQEDEWLETVRLYPGFQEFLALLQKN